jgi:hypothetical protein
MTGAEKKDDMPLPVEDTLDSMERLTFEEIVQAREELVAMGILRDSGRRKFEPRTGRYEIIWVMTELGRRYDWNGDA